MKRNELVERVADYMIEEGRKDTQYGTYIFTFDELASVMYKDMDYTGDIPAEHWLINNYRSIQDALDEHEELLEPTEESRDADGFLDGFDLNFGLAYCPNVDWSAWEGIEVDCIDFHANKYAEDPTEENYQELVEALQYHYSLNDEDAEDLASLVLDCDDYESLENLLHGWEIPEDDEDEEEETPSFYSQALELLADVLCDYDDKIVTWGDDWDEDELKSFTDPRDKLAKAIKLLSRPLEMVRINYSIHTEEEDEDDALVDLPEEDALDFLVSLADKDATVWSVERVPKGTPSPWSYVPPKTPTTAEMDAFLERNNATISKGDNGGWILKWPNGAAHYDTATALWVAVQNHIDQGK